MNSTPEEAAERFAASAIKQGFVLEALHPYTDEQGQPSYWRLRLKHPSTHQKKIFPMRQTESGYELKEPIFEGKKPLYKLHELIQRNDEIVLVCEGEQCVDVLNNIGVLATTSGSCGSAAPADWIVLADREVHIWPDHDDPGQRYANEVSEILLALNCTVRVIDVKQLDLPAKGDAVDWLEVHPHASDADALALPMIKREHSKVEHTETLAETLKRLTQLTPLDYEQAREDDAKRLGVRVGVLDQQVRTAKRVDKAEGTKMELFPLIVPWPEPVDGVALLDELFSTIKQFIICSDETATAAALWCTFTWFIDVAQVAPIAAITAPEKRCGKSQLLTIMGKLSCRPLVASNISTAALFRVIEAHRPTLLIDEADSFLKDNEELRGVINSGHTRQTAYVIRTVGEQHEPKQFSTWGAKAISGIGQLAETIMDRAIVLALRRKLPHETVKRLRYAELGLFDELRSKLARFAEDASVAIEHARPELPEALNDRAQDNWEPLLAIADHVGGEWPARARVAALQLSGHENEPLSLSAELLADIREIFEQKGNLWFWTTELLDALNEDELKPWRTYNGGKPMNATQLARRLKEYGIESQNIRQVNIVRKGFKLEHFQEAFNRYLSPFKIETEDIAS